MSDKTPYTTLDTTPRHTRSLTTRLSKKFINKIKNDEKKHKQLNI